MDDKNKTVVVEPAVVPKVDPSTTTISDDEALIAKLEKEKADLIVEAANYKVAFLKEKSKREVDPDETEEDRVRRITKEELAKTRISQIDADKEVLVQKLVKENKELKLAQLNKTTIPPQGIGSHNEGIKVPDTQITADQLAAFKAKGWTDKDIERYKKNLQKYGGR